MNKTIFLGIIWLISAIAFLYCIFDLPTIKYIVASLAALMMIKIAEKHNE
jgi:hypothetical protein